MTEYDYNEHDLLVEKREYYNIGELSGKTVYEYDTNGLLAQTQVYDLLSRDRPETHFIYEYSDSNRVVKKYRIDDEGNKELESRCKREYYPNGKLKTVVRNSIVQEKYDEQGQPIDERPDLKYSTKTSKTTAVMRMVTGLKQRISKIMLILARGSVVY